MITKGFATIYMSRYYTIFILLTTLSHSVSPINMIKTFSIFSRITHIFVLRTKM